MKIFLTLSTPCDVPERAVFYADRYTTVRNVAQFLAQIAKRRSKMSNYTCGRALQTIVAINVTRPARHCAVEC